MAIKHEDVAFCKIYPPIGIARVGNSTAADGVFVAGTAPGEPPYILGAGPDTPFSYKDSTGAVRRQGARFHIFAFSKDGKLLGELLDGDAEIKWTVQLANKKAAWFEFQGAHGAQSALEGMEVPEDASGTPLKPRNALVGTLERVSGGPFGHRFVASDDRKKQLEIHGPVRCVSGKNRRSDAAAHGDLSFVGNFRSKHRVYLGELATDDAGRLVVIGGHGVSAPIGKDGLPILNPADAWITHYANNDNWHDDTSDGPVRAEVLLRDSGGKGMPVEVRGDAWVVVAPPDFAPDTTNLVTLYDVMEEVAHNHPALRNGTTPQMRDPNCPELKKDIWPIFQRMAGYRWVNKLGLRGHGQGRPGDILSGKPLQFSEFAAADSRGHAAMSQAVRRVLRVPCYRRPRVHEPSKADLDIVASQANSFFMPPLSGDEGDRTDGEPGTWLTLTYLQHARICAWADGRALRYDFGAAEEVAQAYADAAAVVAKAQAESQTALLASEATEQAGADNAVDLTGVEFRSEGAATDSEAQTLLDRIKHEGTSGDVPTSLPPGSIPELITRGVLERCCGGAFFPGIEVTSTVRDSRIYSEAFRFDSSVMEAGDVTKYMAVPWQADFFECQGAWWPAQRPDDVVHEATFQELFDRFIVEDNGDLANVLERILGSRQRWDRGVGDAQPRPTDTFILGRLLPEPGDDTTLQSYCEAVGKDWSRRILSTAPDEDAASPWRMMYLQQEACDRFAGRYFLPRLRAPEQALEFDELAKNHPRLVKTYALRSVSDLRAAWQLADASADTDITDSLNAICEAYKTLALEDIAQYFVLCALKSDTGVVGAAKATARSFRQALAADSFTVADFDKVHRGEIERDTPEYYMYALAEFRAAETDAAYLRFSARNGDNAMVSAWKELGFVAERQFSLPDGTVLRVPLECGRDKYHGASLRDSFYYLMNIQDHQDFIPQALRLADGVLERAQSVIEETGLADPGHPESFVPYSREVFQAKLDEVYEIMRRRAQNYDIYERARRTNWDSLLQGLRDLAPFNQCDGAWLRNISGAGADDKVRALLFEVWSDEIGNGNPALHHGNLFTSLLRSVGIQTFPLNSREYADDPQFDESSLNTPVFELAISQHAERFLPELLGMTLFLEWEVLSLVTGIKLYDYLGLDSHFWQMHVGIDNATNGHGAKARDAVMLYLDQVRHEGGNEAVAEHWARIWRGYVAFATADSGLFGNDLDVTRRRPPGITERLDEMITRKAAFGAQNHLKHRIGRYRINDLFDDPEVFRTVLAGSKWIVRGSPDESQFIAHLTTFNGPMYQIFNPADLSTWREWIDWLGREGDTARVKQYFSKGTAMEALLREMRSVAEGVAAHSRYRVGDKNSPTIAELFAGKDVRAMMDALRASPWVVVGDPAASPLVADLLRGGKTMGKALDRRFPRINNRIGRQIVIEWVAAGCPIPGEDPKKLKVAAPLKQLGPRLYMHSHGFGAVH